MNFLSEYQNRRPTFISNIFDFIHSEKNFIQLKCAQFLTAQTQVVLQDLKKSFEDVHFDAKTY